MNHEHDVKRKRITSFNEELSLDPELVAPCGVNCALCIAYFGYTMNGKKRKDTCIGCREKNKKCAFLKNSCPTLAKNEIEFCFDCNTFPCDNLENMDKKYRERYNMSMIENLQFINENGIEKFLEEEKKKYTCPECSDFICVHTGICYTCSR